MCSFLGLRSSLIHPSEKASCCNVPCISPVKLEPQTSKGLPIPESSQRQGVKVSKYCMGDRWWVTNVLWALLWTVSQSILIIALKPKDFGERRLQLHQGKKRVEFHSMVAGSGETRCHSIEVWFRRFLPSYQWWSVMMISQPWMTWLISPSGLIACSGTALQSTWSPDFWALQKTLDPCRYQESS